nr:anti-sigma factor [uncultured Psychroserpens sp.]
MEKTYILENGLLERYVLGELSKVENQQIEAALNKYPELKTELEAIETSFETLAIENAIDVPTSVKPELLKNISNATSKVVSISSQNTLRPYLKITAGIAAVFCIGLIYMFTQLNATKKQLRVVEEENTKLNRNIENLNNYLMETNKWYVAINDPDVQKYVLKGNALMPEATVISYVNDAKKSVVINTKRLPKLDADHDYQMWADVEGEMINMGIIDRNKDMLAMNYIDNTESLNITIEPAGGNDHPTVSQLITNVYLK